MEPTLIPTLPQTSVDTNSPQPDAGGMPAARGNSPRVSAATVNRLVSGPSGSTSPEQSTGQPPLVRLISSSAKADQYLDADFADQSRTDLGVAITSRLLETVRTEPEEASGFFQPREALGTPKAKEISQLPSVGIMEAVLDTDSLKQAGAVAGLFHRNAEWTTQSGLEELGIEGGPEDDIPRKLMSDAEFSAGFAAKEAHFPTGVDKGNSEDMLDSYYDYEDNPRAQGAIASQLIETLRAEKFENAVSENNLPALRAEFYQTSFQVQVQPFDGEKLTHGTAGFISSQGLCAGTVEAMINKTQTAGSLEAGVQFLNSVHETAQRERNGNASAGFDPSAMGAHLELPPPAGTAGRLSDELGDFHSLQRAQGIQPDYYAGLGLAKEQTVATGDIDSTLELLLPSDRAGDRPEDHFFKIDTQAGTQPHAVLFGAKDGQYFFWDFNNLGLMKSESSDDMKAAVSDWMTKQNFNSISVTKLVPNS